MLDFHALESLLGQRLHLDVQCPECGPNHDNKRRVLRLYAHHDAIGYTCARCGTKGLVTSNGRKAEKPARPPARPEPKRDTRPTAQAIWREATSPRNTIVEEYFRLRGLELTDDLCGRVIRIRQRVMLMRKGATAMIALIRNIHTDEPQGTECTVLNGDGSKGFVLNKDGEEVSRVVYGQKKYGAIKISHDEDVTLALGVAEGFETALSMHLLAEFGATPVWALLDASNLENFPVLPGLECLFIGVDNDKSGRGDEVSERLKQRYLKAGVEVVTIRPRTLGHDINDVVKAND